MRTEADGFSGDIWILSNRYEVTVKILHVQKHFIHMILDNGGNKQHGLSRRSMPVLTIISNQRYETKLQLSSEMRHGS